MTFQLSKQEIVKEIVKSGKDPVYFINNYAKISHPMHGLIPFSTYDFQTSLLETFMDNRFTVVLKARQLGISTISAAYIAWLMMFHRDKNVLVVATKFQTASNLVKKVKSIHRHLPKWLKIAEISIDNRTSFELSNGSQIKAAATSSDAGRSEALSLLVIDEAAHVEGLDELWTGLYPTLSTGGGCIALSTTYTQSATKNGFKKKLRTCPVDKSLRSLSATSTCLEKQFFTQKTWRFSKLACAILNTKQALTEISGSGKSINQIPLICFLLMSPEETARIIQHFMSLNWRRTRS